MTALEQALRHICADLARTRHPFALVGGLAVSARTKPRFTRDADIAVAVASDTEAEATTVPYNRCSTSTDPISVR